jgi:hypothetical protein
MATGLTKPIPTDLTKEIEDAIEAEAQAEAARIRARRRVERLMASEQSHSQCARPIPPVKDRDLSGPELDKVMDWSAATRRRLELKPSYFAGDQERSPRYDLDDVRRQLVERGAKPTTPAQRPKTAKDDIDISAELAKGGLRAVSR